MDIEFLKSVFGDGKWPFQLTQWEQETSTHLDIKIRRRCQVCKHALDEHKTRQNKALQSMNYLCRHQSPVCIICSLSELLKGFGQG